MAVLSIIHRELVQRTRKFLIKFLSRSSSRAFSLPRLPHLSRSLSLSVSNEVNPEFYDILTLARNFGCLRIAQGFLGLKF